MPATDRRPTTVVIESGRTRAFASALDWPGWCRAGRDEQSALAALESYADRYRSVAARAGLTFVDAFDVEVVDAVDVEVVERLTGNATTDFGAPGAIASCERQLLTAHQAGRLARLVEACWAELDATIASSPSALRKGPRGGGRDRDVMAAHVLEAERSYARKLGLRFPAVDLGNLDAVAQHRRAIAEAVARGGTDGPTGRWPASYAARRIAWHTLDHAWEMADRGS